MSAVTQFVGELKRHTGLAWAERRSGGSTRNAAYSILDYVSQPVAMVLAAPFLLRTLGTSQYGIWMIVMAVVGSLSVLGSGFGDATVKYVSEYRGKGDVRSVERVIRSTLTINTALACLFGAIVWAAAPFAARVTFKVEPALLSAAVWSLRIGGILLVLRSIESVFISTLRAYEDYGATVRVSVVTRVSTIVVAVVLSAMGFGVFAIVIGSVIVCIVGLMLQVLAVRSTVGPILPLPSIHRESLNIVFLFGCFSWMQALAGIIFSHADRLLVGAMLGTAAVAFYAICVQVAQTIHGFAAAAFNVVFPYVSHRYSAGDHSALSRALRVGLTANLVMTLTLALPMVFLSKWILTLWMGTDFAVQTHSLLSVLAIAFGVLATNVVPHYVLLAVGKVRFVSAVNVLGGLAALLATVFLIPKMGLLGAALGRMLYGPVVSLNLIAVFRHIHAKAGPGVLKP